MPAIEIYELKNVDSVQLGTLLAQLYTPQGVLGSRIGSVSITPPDQNWVLFPLDKIASIESLIADFAGELAKHEGP